MKKSKLWLYALMALAGGTLFTLGNFVWVTESVKAISGLSIGLGAALFCLGVGNFMGALLISTAENEKITRKKNIEVNDERNTRIREKVGAKTNQILAYVISGIVLVLGFMGANLTTILLLSSVLLLQLVLAIVLSNYYSKRI